ncbi:hypothetical protein PDIG_86650 [Penicillium digitatum PHI26]|uniref:Uncharacterized protein n=3 Tax=Penicillium digitatum TaxID=36651 RepID=K9F731_PEND2|nr:hypothetical protein PDIP_32660 [Penicillium digitatum Pd1]EKV04864.1 hypothetical protein PDIG_86650 [Penicillium digitatum PHI26]EKV17130.1 hypothetical protein PDIP_32660 [Penicillium digitatum Pd1]
MVYQVYLNRMGDPYYSGEILTIPNRHYADEFYNRCITTTAGAANPLNDLVRYSPQFWALPMTMQESRLHNFLTSNAKDLIPTTMIARTSGSEDAPGALPPIPNDATSNVEYLSGGAYYIRTKSTPHLYWIFQDKGQKIISLDSRKATKFQINRDDSAKPSPALPNDRRVLERKDDIELVVLSPSGGHTIGVSNHYVSTTVTSFHFTFGGFYNGDFGVDWSLKSSNSTGPHLAYQVQYAGEEWELVN